MPSVMTTAVQSDQAILNLAAYKFVPLNDLPRLRAEMLEVCKRLGLKGTVLLSSEGINLFVAGHQVAARTFLDHLLADERFENLEVKESFSDRIPFNRMLVKLKKEIIAFGVDGIQPHVRTAPKLSASELKRWLDDGRDVFLLDVRNDFEVAVGTFENAVASGIDHFRDFENSIERLPDEAKGKPIVMFCTGGIRCEKAGPLMQEKGFENVYQLDGGILKYFELCGGDHYQGDCFVFDGRVAVDPALNVSGLAQCFACQSILTAEDQVSDTYVIAKSCPYCYRSEEQKAADRAEKRQRLFAKLTEKLPGSEPHQQSRPIRIPTRLDGLPLEQCLAVLFPQIPAADWERAFLEGRILDGNVPARGARCVRSGEEFTHIVNGFIEPDVNADVNILWEDEAIIVVNKPAPLPVHPSGRFFHNTLTRLLGLAYKPEVLRAVHRLDANTSGVMVLARRRSFAQPLQQQFEAQTTSKTYVLRCHGQPQDDAFICDLPIGVQPGAGRIRIGDPEGDAARTKFQVVERLDDGTSILLATPITGRTNQIRVHLWELGYPICRDPLYLPNHSLGRNEAQDVDAAPMCLHAKRIGFKHSVTNQPMEFEAPEPEWVSGPL
jgi:UPF0176 protein